MDALTVIKLANSKALVHVDPDNETVCMIEDVGEPGRYYRLEFQTTREGHKAVAFVRYTPVAVPPEMAHLSADAQLDMGYGWQRLQDSSTSIAEAIFKARFWCTAHSHFMANRNLITLESAYA